LNILPLLLSVNCSSVIISPIVNSSKFDLTKYDPCSVALDYYATQPDFETAWDNCHRGDWMLWIAKRLGVNLQLLTLAKGYCANTVRHLMKDERSIAAVDAAIAFGEGRITRDELDDAYYAATTNAAAAAYYAADSAAAAAADATDDAADSAAAAAADDDGVGAKTKNQKQTADICRKYLTDAVFTKITEV
jgi:hypothetical protein